MRHIWIVGVLALTSLEATAQQTEAAQQQRETRVLQRAQSQSGLGRALRSGPPAETFSLADDASGQNAQMALFAGEEEGRATLSFAVSKQLRLTVSAPWNDNADTKLADLDGLADATRIGGEYEWRFAKDPGRFSGASFAFAIEGSAGYKSFDFFDAAAEKQSERKKMWSAGSALAARWERTEKTGGLLVLKYTRESAYEDDSSSVGLVCTALSATTQHCEDGFLSPPPRAETDRASISLRWIGSAFGIDSSVTRDFDRHITGVELPLYLVRERLQGGELGDLKGGLTLGWRSDTDEITVGLFVGANLSLD
jgi:hypothetical protein